MHANAAKCSLVEASPECLCAGVASVNFLRMRNLSEGLNNSCDVYSLSRW